MRLAVPIDEVAIQRIGTLCVVVRASQARKSGGYGIAVGDGPVQPFGLWERIRISEIMEFESPPGKELAPPRKPVEMWGSHFSSGHPHAAPVGGG